MNTFEGDENWKEEFAKLRMLHTKCCSQDTAVRATVIPRAACHQENSQQLKALTLEDRGGNEGEVKSI